MINFNSKFNSKASNIGFFISNDLKFKPSTSIPQSTISKINSFLKKKSKDNKKQIFSLTYLKVKKCFNFDQKI